MQQFYRGMNELGKQVLDKLNPRGSFNRMNEDDARSALERMYRTNRNWRTSVRARPVRAPVQVTQSSSIEEQLEALRNNMNTQINILQGKAIKEVNFICEFFKVLILVESVQEENF